MINEEAAFFEKYKDCAEQTALEAIWQAKITNLTSPIKT